MTSRLKFGTFIAPFHRLGDNPTLAFERDMELIQWLDTLGYDEAWIGEHHSGGWETIASPELIIAMVAAKTRRIMLGTGVTSLPYHNPFMVAQRFVQLDHMTRGRVMLGCGPGAVASDAYMLGIDPTTQRTRMDEALGVITRLLRSDEPVTMKTDWFELREARLHLAPYTAPHFPIAVANMFTPTGMKAAGKHNIGVISLGAGMPGGPEAMAEQWKIAEAEATKYGHTMDRKNWRIVVNMHVAEDDEQALREVYQGERLETVKYFEEGLGRPVGRTEDPLRDGVANGSTLVGTPETVIKGIKRLIEYSNGGFGCMLFKAGDWATREQTLRSYELFARWVMPHFQGSLVKPTKSYEWVKANNQTLFSPNVAAIKKAFADSGEEMPEELKGRLHGGRYS